MTEITTSSDLTVELIDTMGDDDSIIRAMLVSTQGAESLDAEASQGRIDFLMKNRHGTPFEHNSMTFFVDAPIAVFREWHRHRVGISYNETSGRYRQLEPRFYIPPPERPLVQVGKPGHYRFVPGDAEQYDNLKMVLETNFNNSYNDYEWMLEQGIAKEVARGVLPVYIYSQMYVTLNARTLMAFLSLRSTYEGYQAMLGANPGELDPLFPSYPMWEIEQCALKMERTFRGHFPMTHSAFRRFGSVCP